MDSLYGWGSNKYKQISPTQVQYVYSPTCHPQFEHLSPAKIASGDNHTLVLSDYGDLYSFGRGNCNCCHVIPYN